MTNPGDYAFGPVITFSGMVSVQLGQLSGYQPGSTLNQWDDTNYIGDPFPTTFQPGWHSNNQNIFTPWNQPTFPNTIPALQPNVPGLHPFVLNPSTILTQHKGCFYNREDFFDFIEQCKGKFLVFMDNGVEKIVDRVEALKFIFFHFLAARKYRNWDEFKYEDDEWLLYLREAKTAPELIAEFNFTRDQIREILSI